MAARKKALTAKQKQEVVASSFEEDAGLGTDFNSDELAIPFLVILQKGSPQIDDDHPDHHLYEDLEASTGDIYNTVTKEVFDSESGIEVIPCGHSTKYVEWRPRTSGGGFVGQHEPGSATIRETTRNEKNQEVLPNGNVIVETHYYFVLCMTGDNAPQQAVVSMTSTQLKKSRHWNSLMKNLRLPGKTGAFNPPMFSQRYRMTTVQQSNDKGTWRGWEIERIGSIEDPDTYAFAKDFFKIATTGGVQVAPPLTEEPAQTTASDVY